jgi:general secretion pathway protein N
MTLRRNARSFAASRLSRASGWADSTLDEMAWRRGQRATLRWGWWGAGCGALAALLAFAPAAWVAAAVNAATGQRLQLAQARGSVWAGSAVLVLGGGTGSRDAAVLPGRLNWSLRPRWNGAELVIDEACCLRGELALRLRIGSDGIEWAVPAMNEAIGDWPASLLVGLGAPWNSLKLDGSLRLSSGGVLLRRDGGRWRMTGAANLELLAASASVSPLPVLGSWRLSLRGDADGSAALTLSTLAGPLLLSGSGYWRDQAAHFRGEAQADPGQEAALSNLLNIVGRRQGARSLIAIG